MARSFAFLLLLFLLPACSGLSYVAENGIGQWRMFNRARPVNDVMASPRTTEATRRAIRVVEKAKAFAVGLGLKATANYQSFVQLDGPCLVWAVSAADPLRLEEKKWRFPVVGEVPYLGFFRQASAENEAARLRQDEAPEPDTWVRCVPAFSSLGWFADPLYSSMLKGRDRDIAELVIHESLHATVWVGDSVDFNEKLANFVGLEGSLRYAEREGGSEALAQAKAEVAGEKLFGDFLHAEVQSYRATVRDAAAKEAFYMGLEERYQRFLRRAKEKTSFAPMPVKFTGWNNAALLTYSNYYADFSVFERMLAQCAGNLGRFVGWIAGEQEKGNFGREPEARLAELAERGGCGK